MKKLLSYIWPHTRKVPSEFNGDLEITYINGKKVLDTENANYSYGTLQKILEKGLAQFDLSQVEAVLILGLGGGSVIHSLREKYAYSGSIVAVEIDPAIVELAASEFDIKASNMLEIIVEDAYTYVENTTKTFDLIIVDLFIDTRVPEKFYGQTFIDQLLRLLQKNGKLLFNMGINLQKDSHAEQVHTYLQNQQTFHTWLLTHVEGTNTLLLSESIL